MKTTIFDFKNYLHYHQIEFYLVNFFINIDREELGMYTRANEDSSTKSTQQSPIELQKQSIEKHLRHQYYLLKIIKLFDLQSIDYVVLKGLPLNQQLFADKLVRSSKDIDLLIPLPKFANAHACLLELGFELKTNLCLTSLINSHATIYPGLKDITYVNHEHQIEIELHWRTAISYSFGFDFVTIKNQRKIIEIAKYPIFILNNEYNFVYLCIHGATSHWRRLKWLLDIAFFVQNEPCDWSKILDIANKHQALRCVLEAQILLKKFTNKSNIQLLTNNLAKVYGLLDNRCPSQLAAKNELQGNSKHKTAVSALAHKDSSTKSTQKFAYREKFQNKYNPAFISKLTTKIPTIKCSILDKLTVALHVIFIQHLWRTCRSPTPKQQLLQLLLHPKFSEKYNFFCNRLSARNMALKNNKR